MTRTCISEIKNRTLIKVSGNDAKKFLQGIVTCNIEEISCNRAGFGGLLTPQGKILFDFFIIRMPYGFLLDIAKTMTEDLITRLNFYRLRAEVKFDICEDKTLIFAMWGGVAPTDDQAIVIPDPRLSKMGWRLYSSTRPGIEKNTIKADYNVHRITLGMPEGGVDYPFGTAFPHEALYDQIGGVDFSKGCYVGQEVISRMHHRGTARKRIIQVKSREDLPCSGTKITVLKKPVGEITSVSGNTGLANLRLDRVNEAMQMNVDIIARNISITASIQPWTTIDWPTRT